MGVVRDYIFKKSSSGASWDIRNLYDRYTVPSLNISRITGMAINPSDGVTMPYVNETKRGNIELGAAWELGSFTTYNSISNGFSAKDMFMHPNGDRVYVSVSGGTVREYSLPISWNLNNWNLNTTKTLISTENPDGMWFSPDGLKMYIGRIQAIDTYNIAVAWDLSTMVFDFTTVFSDLTTLIIGGIFMSPDGTKLVVGQSQLLSQYILTSPFDVSTKNLDTTFNILASPMYSVYPSYDGLNLYFSVNNASRVGQYKWR